MKIVKTKIKDLLILKTKIYKDKRGFFKEVYKKKKLNKNFIFDFLSYSKKKYFKRPTYTIKKTTSKINYCRTWKNFRRSSRP